jgi:hypothetical protein
MTWQSTVKILDGVNAQKVSFQRDSRPVSYDEVLSGWRDDARFRTFFTKLLADSPFSAYRWETPPVTTSTLQRAFEFVLYDAPELNRTPDPTAFADALANAPAEESVAAFANLGNDAVLIVPRLQTDAEAYGHLAAFVRRAPDTQRHDFWRVVSAALRARLGQAPLWLNTSGLQVPWLHARLDSRPKYYRHQPYR